MFDRFDTLGSVRFLPFAASVAWCAVALPQAAAPRAPDSFRFVLIGDRTGETVAGIYERVIGAAAGEHPAFLLNAGDTIQGLNDRTAEAEWQEWERLMRPFRGLEFHLTPGNHDVWSEASANLFRRHAGSAEHYGFDYGSAHFTVLDNSRSEDLTEGEMEFLERDLRAHAAQPLKFVVSHRPSWLLKVLLRNPDFAFHKLMLRYGVRYVIAGHVHEMLHYTLDGVEYVSLPSAGGHLRASEKYDDGWFFGYVAVEVKAGAANFRVRELAGRTTSLDAWGAAGLRER